MLAASQKRFLTKRLRQVAAYQPRIMELRTKLLRVEGQELVVRELGEPDLDLLIERGALREGSVVLEAGEIGRCFSNVAKQWAAQRIGLVQIGVGYGLSDDGLWRGHAWGRLDDGHILETTLSREKYFGVELDGAAANEFARSCLSPE
jgi:hypothetical protein